MIKIPLIDREKLTKKGIPILVALVTIFLIRYIFIESTTSVFYYYHNSKPKKILKNRIHISSSQYETDLQHMLRAYLDGSSSYEARIPFNGKTQLLAINQDANENILVLNWDAYFYRVAQEDPNFEKDIALFLKTIKKNTSIKKVYFLVRNEQLDIEWKTHLLDKGIILKEIE